MIKTFDSWIVLVLSLSFVSIVAIVLQHWSDAATSIIILGSYVVLARVRPDFRQNCASTFNSDSSMLLSIISLVFCLVSVGLMMSEREPTRVLFHQVYELIVIAGLTSLAFDSYFILCLEVKALAAHGAICAHLGAVEKLSNIDAICVDMVGTVTANKLCIQADEIIVYCPEENNSSLLEYAAAAAAVEDSDSKDTADIIGNLSLDAEICRFRSNNALSLTEATFSNRKRTNSIIRIMKDKHEKFILLDKREGMTSRCIHDAQRLKSKGYCVAVVEKIDENGVWHIIGLLPFFDPPRPGTKDSITLLNRLGIEVKLVTGHQIHHTAEVCRRIGLDDNSIGSPLIATPHELPAMDSGQLASGSGACNNLEVFHRSHGFADIFPQHKAIIVECLGHLGHYVAVTGDGLQHIEAMKRAAVGIAVAGATDGVREVADVVLIREGLQPIAHCVYMSKCILQRVNSAISARAAHALHLMLFLFIAWLSLRPIDFQPNDWKSTDWPDFFFIPIPVIGLMFIGSSSCIALTGCVYNYKLSQEPKCLLWIDFLMLSIIPPLGSVVLLYLHMPGVMGREQCFL